jgi:hypothetical protein
VTISRDFPELMQKYKKPKEKLEDHEEIDFNLDDRYPSKKKKELMKANRK